MGKKSGNDGRIPETPEEQQLAREAIDEAAYGRGARPIRAFLIKETMQGDDERRSGDGRVSAGVRQSYGAVRPQAEAGLAAGGARPGSNRFAAGVAGMAEDEGMSLAGARTGTRMATDNQRLSNITNLVRMGTGDQATAMRGLTDLTRSAANQARHDAAVSAENRAFRQSVAGSVVGAGLHYGGKAIAQRRVTNPQNYGIGGQYGPDLGDPLGTQTGAEYGLGGNFAPELDPYG